VQQFQVEKAVLGNHRMVTAEDADIANGEIKVRIDKFAFTANNITYGVMGEQLSYWDFFPAIGDQNKWGVLPVWGFAVVVASTLDSLPEGERLFGYFPPATELILKPEQVTNQRFHDVSEHRTHLPPAYNLYRRVSAEPDYNPALDDLRMLLYPLHLTSFCLWDYLRDNQWFDAEQVIVLSASSKTSIGLAYALHSDDDSKPSVGLTSNQNLDFVSSLGYYDQSLSYAAVETLNNDIASVIVDMSGNQQVMSALHQHLGDNMKRCLNVGITHWEETKTSAGINIDRSEIFFAPGHIQKRLQQWGPEEFEKKSSGFLMRSIQNSTNWLQITGLAGLEGLSDCYADMCEGKLPAEKGMVVHL